jgi:hypothetical protein
MFDKLDRVSTNAEKRSRNVGQYRKSPSKFGNGISGKREIDFDGSSRDVAASGLQPSGLVIKYYREGTTSQ